MTDPARRQGKRVVRLPCCPTGWVLLDDVAVALAARCRDEDCWYAFNVSVVGDGEAAFDGLFDGHDFKEVGCLFKCYVLHGALLRLWLCKLWNVDLHWRN